MRTLYKEGTIDNYYDMKEAYFCEMRHYGVDVVLDMRLISPAGAVLIRDHRVFDGYSMEDYEFIRLAIAEFDEFKAKKNPEP